MAVPGEPVLSAAVSVSQVALSWTTPTGSPTSYTLYRGVETGVLSSYKTGLTANTYTDQNLAITYFYTVTATNGDGEGNASNEVQVAPQLPKGTTRGYRRQQMLRGIVRNYRGR